MSDFYKSDAVRRHTKDRGKNVTTRWMAVAEELFTETVRLKAESKRRHDQFCAETLRTSEVTKENAALRAIGEEIQRHLNRAPRIGVSTDDQAAMVGAIVDALNIGQQASRENILGRISDYLGNGGYFNPEQMDHEKVRDLIMACRDELAALEKDRRRLDWLEEQNACLRFDAEDEGSLPYAAVFLPTLEGGKSTYRVAARGIDYREAIDAAMRELNK